MAGFGAAVPGPVLPEAAGARVAAGIRGKPLLNEGFSRAARRVQLLEPDGLDTTSPWTVRHLTQTTRVVEKNKSEKGRVVK